MTKKTLIIALFLITITLFSSVIGFNENYKIINKKEINNSEISNDIIFMLNQVNTETVSYYLEELVKFGPRFTGSENCSLAAQYIYNEFVKLGLEVNFDTWKDNEFECKNVIATLNGEDSDSNAIFIICAHYDTTRKSPGANDDGSGVAAMMSIAKILSQYTFNHTIRFIAFSGEEVGTCGSHAYVKKAYEKRENIIAVLNLETFGYTSSGGKELFILKTPRTEWISQFSIEISIKYYDFIKLNLLSISNRPCDHQAFLDYGYDAVQYVQLNRDDYPIHSPEDNLDKINYSYLTNVTRLILAIAAEFAYKPINLQIKIVTPYENYFYIMDKPILKLPGLNIGRTGLRGMTYILGKAVIRVNISTKSEIGSVFFCIDDISEYYGECKEPPYEWIIQKSTWRNSPLKGKHTIGAYVWTKDGKIAYDEMDIFVLQLK